MHAMITVMDKINSHNQHFYTTNEENQGIRLMLQKRREGCSNLKMEMELAIILVSSASNHSNSLFEYLTHLKSNDVFRAALLC